MKSNLSILLFAAILVIGQSCNRTVYVPNMQNVPLLKEKNEFRSNLNLSNWQAAYGITKGLGAMFNMHYSNGGSLFDLDEDPSAKRRFVEAGIGYFREVSELGVFEIYAGGGRGSLRFDNRGTSINDKFSTKYSRYFVQSSIGLTFENVDLAFSLRYNQINFFDLDTSQYVFDAANGSERDLSLIGVPTYRFIEPAFTLRFGVKNVKAFMQIERVAQLNSDKIDYKDLQYNFGIHINLAKRYEEEDDTTRPGLR